MKKRWTCFLSVLLIMCLCCTPVHGEHPEADEAIFTEAEQLIEVSLFDLPDKALGNLGFSCAEMFVAIGLPQKLADDLMESKLGEAARQAAKDYFDAHGLGHSYYISQEDYDSFFGNRSSASTQSTTNQLFVGYGGSYSSSGAGDGYETFHPNAMVTQEQMNEYLILVQDIAKLLYNVSGVSVAGQNGYRSTYFMHGENTPGYHEGIDFTDTVHKTCDIYAVADGKYKGTNSKYKSVIQEVKVGGAPKKSKKRPDTRCHA